MRLHSSLRLAPILVLAGLSAPSGAGAAESYDACAGFIDSVPAVISTQGTWCLRKDLATAITSGQAITIATSNVTFDCNHFKLGGLAGGASSTTVGVRINPAVSNTIVRNCNVRGFLYGVGKFDMAGYGTVIEDNRFDGSRASGVYLNGDYGTIRRNRILDTGESVYSNSRTGVSVAGDHNLVEDNQIIGVNPSTEATQAIGVQSSGRGLVVRGNRIAQVMSTSPAETFGIHMASEPYRSVVEGNIILNEVGVPGYGIVGNLQSVCIDNRVTGFTPAVISQCQDGGGNVSF